MLVGMVTLVRVVQFATPILPTFVTVHVPSVVGSVKSVFVVTVLAIMASLSMTL